MLDGGRRTKEEVNGMRGRREKKWRVGRHGLRFEARLIKLAKYMAKKER